MSTPPFMTSSQSRARRELAARRRRTRRLLAGLGALLAGAAVATVLAFGPGSSPARRGVGSGTSRLHVNTPPPAPRISISPAGLPLGRPALALSGLGDPRADPVRLRFSNPPRAGILFDLNSGRVLWQRNATLRLPMASLTKMMTALIAVRSPPGDPVLVTREAVAEGGSKVGVLPLGRRVRLESMLYGLMLPSGNDASVALAQHVAGSIAGFLPLMNAEAAQLGLGCTRYSSPSGFYDSGNFTCAADLAVLAHVDLAQPRIARVARTYTASLPFPIRGGKLYLANNNPLLIYGYPGVTGLKTGYTLAAGRCLVATAERHGVRLGVVLLHSSEPGNQARRLLDSGFTEVYRLPAVAAPPLPPGA